MDNTVEAKLKLLFETQTLDSKIDKLHAIRGELPMEVADLEDELAGLQTRIEKHTADIAHLEDDIEQKKNGMKQADELIKRYDAQLGDVKNNREYLALTKEIELQKLEKMASEKKIKGFEENIAELKQKIKDAKEKLSGRKKDLDAKKGELDTITAETEKEEQNLSKLRDSVKEGLDKRLINAYNRIRKSYNNGLAVVTIERESCGGCFSIIPPQRQLDIGTRKKIIVCEHCGRILVDNNLSEEVKEAVNQGKVSA